MFYNVTEKNSYACIFHRLNLTLQQIEYKTEDDILQIADYVYTNYPDNNGFKVEDLEIVRKLRSKQ